MTHFLHDDADGVDDDDVHPDVPSKTRHRLRRRDRRRRPKGRPERAVQAPRDAPTFGGTVVSCGRGHATVVRADGGEASVDVPPELRRAERALAVGDDVVVAQLPDGVARVLRAAPRRSTLSRMDPHNPHRQRVVVANVEVVVVVSAAVSPPLRPRLLDRYAVAILQGGARPLFVVNKADQACDTERQQLHAKLQTWAGLGEGHVVSATDGQGLAALAEALRGTRCAFVGHSGVGKSTLARALGADGRAASGDLAEHGRGRHTTSTATLHRLPGGTELIDTPGVRQFAPVPVRRDALDRAFPAIRDLARGCSWPGCGHTGEPGCAVVDAVDAGALGAARLDSYQRLRAQLVR